METYSLTAYAARRSRHIHIKITVGFVACHILLVNQILYAAAH